MASLETKGVINGLTYIPNFLTQEEIKELYTYLEKEKWSGISHRVDSREVVQYGYIYAYDRSGMTKTDPVPERYLKLLKRVDNKSVDKIDQLIINKYKADQGISPHVDHVKYFSDTVICISIGREVEVIFTSENKEHIYKLKVESGSLYIMTGDARYKYTHSIEAREKEGELRYSLTFRHVIATK
jgi:alkylated DNA repair dioxygenase AlkB